MPITVHVYAMHMQVHKDETRGFESGGLNANSKGTDQAASLQPDLGPRCLLMSEHFHDSEPIQLSIPIT